MFAEQLCENRAEWIHSAVQQVMWLNTWPLPLCRLPLWRHINNLPCLDWRTKQVSSKCVHLCVCLIAECGAKWVGDEDVCSTLIRKITTQTEEGQGTAKQECHKNDQCYVLETEKRKRWYLTVGRGDVELHVCIHILLRPLTGASKFPCRSTGI